MGAPSSSEGKEEPLRDRQQGRAVLPVASGRFQLGTAVGLKKRQRAAGAVHCSTTDARIVPLPSPLAVPVIPPLEFTGRYEQEGEVGARSS